MNDEAGVMLDLTHAFTVDCGPAVEIFEDLRVFEGYQQRLLNSVLQLDIPWRFWQYFWQV